MLHTWIPALERILTQAKYHVPERSRRCAQEGPFGTRILTTSLEKHIQDGFKEICVGLTQNLVLCKQKRSPTLYLVFGSPPSNLHG